MKKRKYQKKEAPIQREILRYLASRGYLTIRFNSGVIKTEKTYFRAYTIENNGKSSGLPDVIAFRKNKFIMFEIKEPKGTMRKTQDNFNDFVKRYNITPYTVTSWVEVMEVLKKIEKEWKNGKHNKIRIA